MKNPTKYTVRHRRKREGKTNYKKRLELLKSRKDRLVIRKTNKQIILQIIRYEPDGDKAIVTVGSSELKKKGWKHSCKNLPACYLAGMLLTQKAKAKNIGEAILDLGLQTPHSGSKLYAALKGAIDAGLAIPANEKIFPSEERLKGKHIDEKIAADYEKIRKEIYK
jgi:large subunit ribosomal protein L18